MHKLTAAQAAVLRQARDSEHGAHNYGPRRRVITALEAAGLLAFVPVHHPRGTAPVGHVWRPTVAGEAELKRLDAVDARDARRRPGRTV